MTAIAHLPTVVRDWHRMGESAAASAKAGRKTRFPVSMR